MIYVQSITSYELHIQGFPKIIAAIKRRLIRVFQNISKASNINQLLKSGILEIMKQVMDF